MTAISKELLAAMALDAYRPSSQNFVDPTPAEWRIDPVLSPPNRGNGFDATVFHLGTSQVVIAFRGTDADSLLGFFTDWDDDISIARGERSDQVEHALELVAETMKNYPGADISFTGHSLGGGLASLMAVFFDRPAYVFAPAPFANSAMDSVAGDGACEGKREGEMSEAEQARDSIDPSVTSAVQALHRSMRTLIAMTSVLLLASCDNAPRQAELTWTEPVQLASGENVTIRRHVEFLHERAFGGGAESAPRYETSTVSLESQTPEFPIWDAPLMPILLDKDATTGDWVIIASSDSCDIWLRNGRPRPPYWAFRSHEHEWIRDAVPTDFIGRKANLFVGIEVTDESEVLDRELNSRKDEFSTGRRSAAQYKTVLSSYQEIENCGSARETLPIGERELDLKKFKRATK